MAWLWLQNNGTIEMKKKNTTQKTTEKRIMFGKLDMQHDKHESHIRWLGVFVPSSFCSLL